MALIRVQRTYPDTSALDQLKPFMTDVALRPHWVLTKRDIQDTPPHCTSFVQLAQSMGRMSQKLNMAMIKKSLKRPIKPAFNASNQIFPSRSLTLALTLHNQRRVRTFKYVAIGTTLN
ncbi:MAG TPA: hypothetical protein DER01_12730 [Phycisphaerales bacterium]|nr:hypothetical protein [Phycisphaerales bacterium]|tara:strand:- start:416 stop:769 length:354 start_codon:yes stop_codon:yes gene_type:complete